MSTHFIELKTASSTSVAKSTLRMTSQEWMERALRSERMLDVTELLALDGIQKGEFAIPNEILWRSFNDETDSPIYLTPELMKCFGYRDKTIMAQRQNIHRLIRKHRDLNNLVATTIMKPSEFRQWLRERNLCAKDYHIANQSRHTVTCLQDLQFLLTCAGTEASNKTRLFLVRIFNLFVRIVKYQTRFRAREQEQVTRKVQAEFLEHRMRTEEREQLFTRRIREAEWGLKSERVEHSLNTNQIRRDADHKLDIATHDRTIPAPQPERVQEFRLYRANHRGLYFISRGQPRSLDRTIATKRKKYPDLRLAHRIPGVPNGVNLANELRALKNEHGTARFQMRNCSVRLKSTQSEAELIEAVRRLYRNRKRV